MRVVLIGYGNIARKHLEVFRALQCDIVASCNSSDRGNQLAKSEGLIPKTYFNYIEMIEKEKPEAIINCVSFDRIFEVTRDLIPYKVPLLVEKPAGTSVAELQELIHLQQQHGTIVQVALNRRHYSVFHRAIEDMGGVNQLDMINIEWSENPLRVKQAKSYTDDQVGKIIFGNSIHGLDMLDYYSGGVKQFEIFTSKKQNFEWNMVLAGRSAYGIPVTFSSTWANVTPWRMVMHSKGKRYLFAPLETCQVFEDGIGNARIIEPDNFDTKFKAGFYRQAEVFLKSITEKNIGFDFELASTLSSMNLAERFHSTINAG